MGQLWARACGLGAQARLGEKFLQISFTLPPRGKKVSAGRCKTASLPSCGIFSPHEFVQGGDDFD